MKPMDSLRLRWPDSPFGVLAAAAGTGPDQAELAGRGMASGSGAGYWSRTPTAFSAPEDRSA